LACRPGGSGTRASAGRGAAGRGYPSEIIFTSCATEATATAIASAIALLPERREIITSAVEHPATLAACEHLERQGYLIHRIAVDSEGAGHGAVPRGAQPARGAGQRDVGE
jgi:cysteine desulfurase